MSEAQVWELQRLNAQAKRIVAERDAEIAKWEAQYERDTDALAQQLAELTNKLEFTEAIVAADGALITGLKNDVSEYKKQIVLLRESLLNAESCLNFWGDVLSPKGKEALASTQDLAGLILCDAKPVRYIYKFIWYDGSEVWRDNAIFNGTEATETAPLYKARKP